MKIVFLTSRFPFPLEKGDKLRVYNQLKYLCRQNEVTLISLNEGNVKAEYIEQVKYFCKNIYIFKLSKIDIALNLAKALLNGLPLQVALFYKKKYKKKIQELIKSIKPDSVHCHLIRMSEYVRDTNGCPKTLDYMDAFSKGIERRSETTSFFLMKKMLFMEYKRLVNYEKFIFGKFERKVIISEQDRDYIPHDEKDKIEILPNGVDTEIFFPLEREKKYDLLFTGNMGYPPNIESALYSANVILPAVHKVNSGINLLIAGINPPREVINLKSNKIFVIPEFSHIREAFAQSKIMLAPMLISIGLQNKILQAMAMKIPCICSSLANNAIKAPVDKCILEANSQNEYSEKIIRLLTDKKYSEELTENAYRFVVENYNWNNINMRLETAV